MTTRPPPPRPATPPAATRSRAGQQANCPTGTCRPRPAPRPPCDFDRLVIRCRHCGSEARPIAGVAFWLDIARRQIMTDMRHAQDRRIPRITDRFEVVDNDTVTITLTGGPGYHPGHPTLTITPPNGLGQRQVLRGARHEFRVHYWHDWLRTRLARLRSLGFSEGLRQFFFPPPAEWTVQYAACGVRPGSPVAFATWQRKITVYPPDLFKISIAIPSYRKVERAESGYREGSVRGRSSGRTETGGWSGTSESRQEEMRVSPSSELYRQTETAGNRHGTVRQVQTLATYRGRDYNAANRVSEEARPDGLVRGSARGITITHNGENWSQEFKVVEFVNFLIDLRAQVLELIRFFQALANRMPRIGWSFAAEVEFFAGNLEYEWGYKEWQTHICYRYYKLQAGLTIFAGKLDIAFGLELLSAKAQVYGAVTGELKLNCSREANPFNAGAAATITVAPAVGGEIGVRGALGDWVEVVGRVNAGFEGAAEVGVAPFSLTLRLDLSAGTGTFTARSRLLFSVTRTATMWEKRPIWNRQIV